MSRSSSPGGRLSRGGDGIFNWYLEDFPLTGKKFRSPAFLLGKCLWYLQVLRPSPENVFALLARETGADDLGPEEIEVTHALGWRKTDGAVVEKGSVQWAFRKGEYCTFLPILKTKDFIEFLITKTVTCRFIDGEETEPRSKEIEDLESLSSDLQRLLTSGEESDVVIKVQGREFRAHRLLLTARSPVFRATFCHDSEEARTGVVEIPDCDPESFPHLLNFLYSGKVGEMTFEAALGLYESADKYDVQALKSSCSDLLGCNLTPESVCDVVLLADLHSDDELASAAQLYFNENYIDVLQTSAWMDLMKKNPRVAAKLSKEMAATAKRLR